MLGETEPRCSQLPSGVWGRSGSLVPLPAKATCALVRKRCILRVRDPPDVLSPAPLPSLFHVYMVSGSWLLGRKLILFSARRPCWKIALELSWLRVNS